MIEPGLAEGGNWIPTIGFIQAIREICDKNDWLMISDEGLKRVLPSEFVLAVTVGGVLARLSVSATQMRLKWRSSHRAQVPFIVTVADLGME